MPLIRMSDATKDGCVHPKRLPAGAPIKSPRRNWIPQMYNVMIHGQNVLNKRPKARPEIGRRRSAFGQQLVNLPRLRPILTALGQLLTTIGPDAIELGSIGQNHPRIRSRSAY